MYQDRLLSLGMIAVEQELAKSTNFMLSMILPRKRQEREHYSLTLFSVYDNKIVSNQFYFSFD
jgi:hypothetical protein